MSKRNQLIQDNMHVIEAIEEGKRVAAYFETEDQAKQFVARLAEAKEEEKKYFNFEEVEQASKLSRRSDHKVIPSREELSRRLIEGGKVSMMGTTSPSSSNVKLLNDEKS